VIVCGSTNASISSKTTQAGVLCYVISWAVQIKRATSDEYGMKSGLYDKFHVANSMVIMTGTGNKKTYCPRTDFWKRNESIIQTVPDHIVRSCYLPCLLLFFAPTAFSEFVEGELHDFKPTPCFSRWCLFTASGRT